MEIELGDPPPVRPPGELRLDTYRDADAEPLRAAINEAFAVDPFWHEVSPANFRDFYLGARGYDPQLWPLARDSDELAGFALRYPVQGTDTELGWVGTLGVRAAWRRRGLGEALLRLAFAALHERGLRRAGLGVDAENATGALRLYERVGMRRVRRSDSWARTCERPPGEVPRLPDADRGRDRLRVPVPLLRTRVRRGAHSGSARVGRRRRDDGGRRLARSAVARGRDDRGADARAQIEATARELPQRPLVLGGCCCAHVGAVRELARRHGRIGLVWIDAHGDLNTPETSPSGNPWGMPLRMLIDAGDVAARDVILLGARCLDPPESDFVRRTGIRERLGDLPDRVYVALDCDVLAPGSVDVFMPEPGGPTPAGLEPVLASFRRPRAPGSPASSGRSGTKRSCPGSRRHWASDRRPVTDW